MSSRDTVAGRFEGIWHDLKNAYHDSASPPQSRKELCHRLSGNGSARLEEFALLSDILRDLFAQPRVPPFPLNGDHIESLTTPSDSTSSGSDFANALEAVAKKYEEEYGHGRDTPALTIGPSGPRADLALALMQTDFSDVHSPPAGDRTTLAVWTDSSPLSSSIRASLSCLLPVQNIRAVSTPIDVIRVLYEVSPEAMVCVWIDEMEAELFTDPRCPTLDSEEVSWTQLPSSSSAKSTSTLLVDLLSLIN